MRISNATLRSYGIFRNRRVEFDETQSIFLAHGRNEGGKSTLLSFMRKTRFAGRAGGVGGRAENPNSNLGLVSAARR